jgi:SAM-dependent methyltransferase
MSKISYGDPIWEELLSSRNWGQYPPEEVVRFFFRVASERACREVLDIGCGQGACSWFFAKQGCDVTAFDGAPSGLDRVNPLANFFCARNEITLLLGDITKPKSYVERGYDILLDNYSLCANPEDEICRALEDYYDILKNGGSFLFNVFGENTTGFGTGAPISKNTYRCVGGSLRDRGTITWFTRDRVNSIADSIGFTVTDYEDIFISSNSLVTERLSTHLTK